MSRKDRCKDDDFSQVNGSFYVSLTPAARRTYVRTLVRSFVHSCDNKLCDIKKARRLRKHLTWLVWVIHGTLLFFSNNTCLLLMYNSEVSTKIAMSSSSARAHAVLSLFFFFLISPFFSHVVRTTGESFFSSLPAKSRLVLVARGDGTLRSKALIIPLVILKLGMYTCRFLDIPLSLPFPPTFSAFLSLSFFDMTAESMNKTILPSLLIKRCTILRGDRDPTILRILIRFWFFSLYSVRVCEYYSYVSMSFTTGRANFVARNTLSTKRFRRVSRGDWIVCVCRVCVCVSMRWTRNVGNERKTSQSCTRPRRGIFASRAIEWVVRMKRDEHAFRLPSGIYARILSGNTYKKTS